MGWVLVGGFISRVEVRLGYGLSFRGPYCQLVDKGEGLVFYI